MKRWIFLILAIIIISIFSIIKSCQRSKREVINVYTDREIEIFVDKLAKKYAKSALNYKNIFDSETSAAHQKLIVQSQSALPKKS